jgi:hypothetical protein
MLCFVDRLLVQHVVDEARAAGVERFIVQRQPSLRRGPARLRRNAVSGQAC